MNQADVARQTLSDLPVQQRAELLARLRAARGAATSRLEPRGDATAPATFQQRTLWFLDRLEAGRATYNVPLYLRLRGELDVRALRQALARVVDRHEALRSCLVEQDGELVQTVAPTVPTGLPLVDAADAPDAVRRAGELGGLPFDLAGAPLWRARLLRIGPSEHLFVFAVHHAVFDGVSIGIFWRDLAEHYRAAVTGTAADLPVLPVHYPDFALWQRGYLAGPAGRRLEEFWRTRLDALPALSLPTDHPRPPELGSDGAVATKALDARVATDIERYARAAATTPYVVCLAAFWVLLHHYSGEQTREVVVGSPTAGRFRSQLADVIGYFAGMVVLRGDLSSAPSFAELVERAGSVTREALAHAELPFEQVVQAVAPERDPSRSPLFQVSFSVADEQSFPPLHGGIQVEELHLDHGVARFDLSWVVSIGREAAGTGTGGSVVVVEYNTALYTAETAHRMLADFTELLEALLAAPADSVHDTSSRVGLAQLRDPGGEPGAEPATDPAAAASPDARREPRNETERLLAEEIFTAALGRRPAAMTENFFQSGGGSLQAAQVVSAIRRRLGVAVGVADFFRAPTVAGLATVVDRRRAVQLTDRALLDFIEALADDEIDRLLEAD